MDGNFENERDIVAYHEAGHAVMAIACEFQVTDITIDPSGLGEGYVAYNTGMTMEGEIAQKAALVAASGLAADMLLAIQSRKERPESMFVGHFSDQENARRYIDLSGVAGSFDDYLLVATMFLKENWSYVSVIAEALKIVSSINPQALNLDALPRLYVDWKRRLDIAISMSKDINGSCSL